MRERDLNPRFVDRDLSNHVSPILSQFTFGSSHSLRLVIAVDIKDILRSETQDSLQCMRNREGNVSWVALVNFDGHRNSRRGREREFRRGQASRGAGRARNGRVTPAVDDPCGAIEYLPTRRLVRVRARVALSASDAFGHRMAISDAISILKLSFSRKF